MRNPFANPKRHKSARNNSRARRQRLPLLPTLAVFAIGIWFSVFIVQLLFPFETWNPFERTVTVGEKVIHEWKYGGVNSAGDMLFFNNFNSVTIPIHQNRFDADGNYIFIKGHTTDTLTIESKDDYLSKFLIGLIGIVSAAGALAAILFLRFFKRNRRPASWSSSPKHPVRGQFYQLTALRKPLSSRPDRFIPARRTRSSGSTHAARSFSSPRSQVLRWRLKVWRWRTRYRK